MQRQLAKAQHQLDDLERRFWPALHELTGAISLGLAAHFFMAIRFAVTPYLCHYGMVERGNHDKINDGALAGAFSRLQLTERPNGSWPSVAGDVCPPAVSPKIGGFKSHPRQPIIWSTARAAKSMNKYKIEYLNAALAGASEVWLAPAASCGSRRTRQACQINPRPSTVADNP